MTNYLQQYKETEMYKEMSSIADAILGLDVFQKKIIYKSSNFEYIVHNTRFKDTINNILNREQQEELKRIGSLLRAIGYIDEGIMLIDIAHWYRYLAMEKGGKDFFEYVHRKYTNKNLRTY